MLVGESPSDSDAEGFWRRNDFVREPFTGLVGAEQDQFLMMNGLHRRRIYITTLVKNHIPNQGNPTRDDVAASEQELTDEIKRVGPRFILAVGRQTVRWFIGDVDLETVHGRPQAIRAAIRAAIPGFAGVVVPCHHPAFGLHDPDTKTLVWWDYSQAAKIIRGEIPSEPVVDEFPNPVYIDASPSELVEEMSNSDLESPHFAVDVEGPIDEELRDQYWGFSVSFTPGRGLVFRRSQPHFAESVGVLNSYIAALDPLVIYHNAMGIDSDILRRMGVKGHLRKIYDTMVAAFFHRVEPQGLKPLARRWCGMEMRTYEEVIGDAVLAKELSYLISIAEIDWGKPEPQLINENDGTQRLYRPQALHTRAKKIITDWESDPETSLKKRWRQIDPVLCKLAEGRFGPWPFATLDDIELDSAVSYSGRDPDATLRLFYRIRESIESLKLSDRLQLDLDILPAFEEMQATGFVGDRRYFEALSAEMWDQMMSIGSRISAKFNDGKPFNPGSAPQVQALALARGLKGAKKTKKGAISTSKKSMEHLRRVDDAMDMIFSWRERQKVKSSFADDILDRIPPDQDFAPIRCNIRVTRVASDRISATDPNLSAMPVASDLGNRVRGGLRAPKGYLLGSADLSQVEMRVIAHESNDPFLVRLFHEERDIHAETAIKIFHLDPTANWNEKKGEFEYPGVHKMRHRNPTKRAGFGVATGIQGPGLLDQLRQMGCEGWRVEKFRDRTTDCISDWCPGGIIHEWFNVFPGVRGFFERCKSITYDKGFITEMGGFPRYLPGIWSRDQYVAGEAGRQSHSHRIQGSAQWMLRKAMRWIMPQIEALREDSGLYCRWVMQIHDEVIFCFAEELEEAVKAIVLEGMTQHSHKLIVPVKASWSTAETWDKLK